MTTATLAPAQVAALDQAVAGWRDACDAFARMTGSGEAMRAAEMAMRAAGRDEASGPGVDSGERGAVHGCAGGRRAGGCDVQW